MWIPIILAALEIGAKQYILGLGWSLVWKILPLFLLTILIIWCYKLFRVILFDIGVVDMYFKRHSALTSISRVLHMIKHHLIETFVFLIAMCICTFACGILMMLALIPFIIISIPIIAGLYFLGKLTDWNQSILIGSGIFLALYMMFLTYALAIVTLPLSVFLRYFTIMNYFDLSRK
jgi:hypothetical protein